MTINWNAMEAFSWDDLASSEEWVKHLNAFLDRAKIETDPKKRDRIAAKLDEFADKYSGDELSLTTKLDSAARKAARALRNENIDQGIKDLALATSDYRAAVKELDVVAASLKKEASVLRAESFTSAVSCLSETILSLKNLSQTLKDGDTKDLAAAITESIENVQQLRNKLEAAS
ncbi:MAG: hypothetical protein Q7R66_15065 [Undibacterium sp.]|uniref:hypothetical protein n=1 Tax=Undibacterium sp. TaxID=1914977 RepID=UPI00271659F5|nr:hypothetical protein [Undibacterium sp.]MDO8653502.1 hypothetical protein [Undibacterium sp.]